MPEYWRTAMVIALRIALPVQGYGHYLLQAMLDENPTQSRSLDVRVIGPGQALARCPA